MGLIIGITGLAGAGKTTVRNLLVSSLSLPYIRFGSLTDEIIKERGWENNEENNKKIRDEIRVNYGMGGYATLAIPKIKKLLKNYRGVIIDGIYSWEEVEVLEKQFSEDKIIIISVIADKEKRYDRLLKRKGRAWSREEAMKRDEHEIIKLNKGITISMADYFICNNGTKEELKREVYRILEEVNKK